MRKGDSFDNLSARQRAALYAGWYERADARQWTIATHQAIADALNEAYRLGQAHERNKHARRPLSEEEIAAIEARCDAERARQRR